MERRPRGTPHGGGTVWGVGQGGRREVLPALRELAGRRLAQGAQARHLGRARAAAARAGVPARPSWTERVGARSACPGRRSASVGEMSSSTAWRSGSPYGAGTTGGTTLQRGRRRRGEGAKEVRGPDAPRCASASRPRRSSVSGSSSSATGRAPRRGRRERKVSGSSGCRGDVEPSGEHGRTRVLERKRPDRRPRREACPGARPGPVGWDQRPRLRSSIVALRWAAMVPSASMTLTCE